MDRWKEVRNKGRVMKERVKEGGREDTFATYFTFYIKKRVLKD